ncbi:MAG: hypothetical protein LBO05_11495 [Deltaproteobacteria bacterium]|jgi:chromosomal replication initiator protein|nr:hypothetical protein [Deltaproteobacteria bacterium]
MVILTPCQGGDDASFFSKIWEPARLEIAKAVPADQMETWIAPLKANFVDRQLVLLAPDHFFKKFVDKYFLKTISGAVAAACGQSGLEPPPVRVCTPDAPDLAPVRAEAAPRAAADIRPVEPDLFAAQDETRRYRQPLNPWNTFPNFVVASSNRMAFECCQEVAYSASGDNNFLLIVSGSGLGKTHLVQAVAEAAAKGSKRVCCLTAQDFARHFVDSIKAQNYRFFAEAYKDFDILVVECIPFFASRPKFESEICETLDYLHNKGSQVILTSTQPLRNIPGLSSQCRSRFSLALSCNIGQPDFDTRMSIMSRVNSARGYRLPAEVLELISATCPPDVRTLYSTMQSLFACGKSEKRPVDVRMAKEFLDYTTASDPSLASLENLKRLIVRAYDIDEQALLSASKKVAVIEARSVGIYLARHLFNHSFPQIGAAFNRRHSTAIYNYNKVVAMLPRDERLRKHVEYLCQQMGRRVPVTPAPASPGGPDFSEASSERPEAAATGTSGAAAPWGTPQII